MIDFILLAIFGLVTWFVAQDGIWGAAITFVSVVIAGLLAMNFFEPLADFLVSNVLGSYEWQHRWDIIALLGIFAGGVAGLRAIAEKLLPTFAPVNLMFYEIGRWGLGLATGYVVMAIVLTSLHVAPLPREFLGFTPERKNFLGITAPDRQWLAFTQFVSEGSLKTTRRDGSIAIFDGAVFPRIPGDNSTLQVWSSFPIKYAARRQYYASGGGPSASPAGPAAPPPMRRPGSGGTSGF